MKHECKECSSTGFEIFQYYDGSISADCCETCNGKGHFTDEEIEAEMFVVDACLDKLEDEAIDIDWIIGDALEAIE